MRYLLFMECGVNKFAEKRYVREAAARATANDTWLSWVLYAKEDGGDLLELDWGGLGLGHRAIRKYAAQRQQRQRKHRQRVDKRGGHVCMTLPPEKFDTDYGLALDARRSVSTPLPQVLGRSSSLLTEWSQSVQSIVDNWSTAQTQAAPSSPANSVFTIGSDDLSDEEPSEPSMITESTSELHPIEGAREEMAHLAHN
eukprot:CAMPEP_0197632804 /NCGR_PEP_ID=MMETSP1338-20131121/9376_1 /TAXON_ID=43686 ORGANISM="Pelagodinium beii, Strain RCC1491" /NCGR_SAMPLE_ID=MMETSP1338 /ASSEMBLY_ACC=CAM_ASM_000754 /LENGTH=197 /DNA_ID=CAMNT_0043204375 /DNA_START=53 /DNA_END=646 /DNA_ORIENTATION=+